MNVNFFWGGEIVQDNNDMYYSQDPKKMQYIKYGTTYEEMKLVVYDLMQISPSHWKLKMSYKYPRLDNFNLVIGCYLMEITCDADVTRMLSIPKTMQMGYGDVSMFIEAEQIVSDQPNSFQQNWQSQPTHASYEEQYGGTGYPPHNTGGWSDHFFQGYRGSSNQRSE